MNIDEGYYDVEKRRTDDCDHGPCTEYKYTPTKGNPQTGFTLYLYDYEPEMISIHEDD